jgi:uncharacterized protein (DUF1778 family)
MRDAAIRLRASPKQRDLIDRAAALQGKRRSDFMLKVACERAQDGVLNQVDFGLNLEKFQQFSTMLDTSTSTTPGLERLRAVNSPWCY